MHACEYRREREYKLAAFSVAGSSEDGSKSTTLIVDSFQVRPDLPRSGGVSVDVATFSLRPLIRSLCARCEVFLNHRA
jgi:hypothetical protein